MVTVSGDVLSGFDGDDDTKCELCGVTFSVCHGGANDVKHFSTQTLDRYGFGQSEVAKRA